MDEALRELIRTLPKAELHLHAEACLQPELVMRLAERNGAEPPYASLEEARAVYDWPDLGAFLDLYYRHIEFLRSEDDYRDLVATYFGHAIPQGVRHVEMFFDPQAHTRRGIALDTVVAGLLAGLDDAHREYGVTSALIACFIRELGVEAAQATLRELSELDGFDRIIGIGLDSIETDYPPPMWLPLYEQAGELGLHRVIHAGEQGPGVNVGLALTELDAERIDHGVRCVEDDATMDELRGRGTALTVCPVSNVRIGMYESMGDHPIIRIRDLGVAVTINSDGPAYFGDLAHNWEAVAETFDLTAAELAAFARASVDASFASDERKAELHVEIDDAVGVRA